MTGTTPTPGPLEEDDMSTELWGPALDAELAYRRESVAAGVREGRAPRVRTATGPGEGRGRGAARTRPARRRWWLVGSGAWHAAR